jgi:hypothetical protein
LKANIAIARCYRKRYRMNVVGKDGATTTVAIPPEVIDRKADEASLSADEFIKCYKAIAHYDNFDGVLYTFEKVSNVDERE